APFNIQASFNVVSKGASAQLRVVGEGEIPTGTVKIKTLALTSGKSTLSLSGTAKKLRTPHPTADLKLEIKDFDVDALRPFVAWPKGMNISGPINGHGSIQGDDQQMTFALTADGSKMAIEDVPSFNKPAKMPLSISLHGKLEQMKTLSLHDVGLIIGSLQATVHGTVDDVLSSRPVATLHLETNAFPMESVASLAPSVVPQGIRLAGPVKISADVSGTAISASLNAKMEADGLSVNIPNQFSKPAGVPFE